MKEYPKMLTLLERSKTTHKLSASWKLSQFSMINQWHVTEKLHGQNIRIHFDGESVQIAGRHTTNLKELPGDLVAYLQKTFTAELFQKVFGKAVTLFGEGVGPGINGGAAYSATKTFVLFDVLVDKDNGQWVDQLAIPSIADSLGIQSVPVMTCSSLNDIVCKVMTGFESPLALKNTGMPYAAEGVIAVARGLYDFRGQRIGFKLKTLDFAPEFTLEIAA